MPPPKITSFFIGGSIARDTAINVLEALLLAGGQRLVIDIDQVSGVAAVNGTTAGLAHSEPLALPAPKPAKKKLPDSRLVLGKLMIERGTVTAVSARDTMEGVGFAPTSTGSLLNQMVKKGLASKKGGGVFSPTAKLLAYIKTAEGGSKPAKIPKIDPKISAKLAKNDKAVDFLGTPPKGLSQQQWIRKIIEAKYPEPVSSMDLKAIFRARNMRRASVSVALTQLKQAGVLKIVSPGAYTLTDEHKPTTERNNGSATT